MSVSMQRVIFRFKSPSGACLRQPSPEMREALMLLTEAEELQPMFEDADKTEGFVSIEVFHNRNGQPILIHFTKEAA